MTGSGLVTFLSVLGTVLAGAGAVLAVLYMRARNARDDLKTQVAADTAAKAAQEETHRLAESAIEALTALRSEMHGLRSEVAAHDSRVSILESKMDVFWRNVAFDVSKILHSPHPGWGDLDALLEKFQAQAITVPEMASLEDQLRDMVEGRWTPAEVTRADQVAASLLLRAIEQTRV